MRRKTELVRNSSKPLSMISPLQSNDPCRQFRGTRSLLRWEGFVEKVGFELGVKGMVWYGRV